MTSEGHPLLGKWRITSMEFWDAGFIDLLGPGYIQFDADGGGAFAFGAVQGEIDGHPGSESIHFSWPRTLVAQLRTMVAQNRVVPRTLVALSK